MQPENATQKTLAQENAKNMQAKMQANNAKTMQLLEICFCKACTFPEFAFLVAFFLYFFRILFAFFFACFLHFT